MTRSHKFNLIIFLILLSSTLLTYKAATPSLEVPTINQDYEKAYSDTVCAGDDNIVKAGCSVIAGQVVRGIPAMIFGASFDKIGDCVKKAESWQKGSSINLNDTCNQIGLVNPKVNKEDFVLDRKGPSNDISLNALVSNLNDLNSEIAKNSFDNSYYVYKNVENIPFAKEAFAQNLNVNSLAAPSVGLYGFGWPLQAITYNSWLIFRNVSYGIIGLLSIVLGLTLMSSNSFLDNNAKWRLSLEQAIPRVIISVILIQFSYILGETLLYIANNENFIPIINYLFGIGDFGGFGRGFLIFIIGLIFTFINALVTTGGGGVAPLALLLGIIIGGLWYLYRLVIIWWQSLQAVIAICILTIASPILIALSLLPGEAGALQLRRYFASLVSLTTQTFLYQLIKVGPGIFTTLLFSFLWQLPAPFQLINIFANVTVPGYAVFITLIPLIVAIIILQYGDQVQNLSNQFAKNLVGADPIGAQEQR